MQTDDNGKIDFKKSLAEWKVTIKSRWWILLVELAVIGVILLADLLTKKYAVAFLQTQPFQSKDGVIPGLIDFEYRENTGAGFSLFQGNTTALIVVTFIVMICLLVYLVFALKESEWLRISLVFIVGGGIGNLVDRIWLGYVRDFIKFAFWDDFAVFNIADSFVTVGAFILIVVLIVMLVKEGKKNQKEFEAKQAANPKSDEGVDPLDMPQNLNPMLRSENEYTFVQSDEKQDNKRENEKTEDANCDASTEDTTEDVENFDKNQSDSKEE